METNFLREPINSLKRKAIIALVATLAIVGAIATIAIISS
jgi:hypothetical protein